MGQKSATIRPAEVTDLPSIEAVARAAWSVAYAGIIPDGVQRRLLDRWYSSVALTRALGAQESTFLVAECEGSVVGFAQYLRRSAESVELTRIYVRPDRQHSGIGTKLLEAGVAAFAQQGVRRLTVLVERDNTVGRHFYARTGFTEVRELSREAEGFLLKLVECNRSIQGCNL